MDVQSDVIPRPVPPPRHKLRKGLVCAKQDEEKSMVSVMWKAIYAIYHNFPQNRNKNF